MLIEFKFSNYRSFRDEACLSMGPMSPVKMKKGLIPCKPKNLMSSAAIFGKNGGGKTNVIRALEFAVKFICNAQRTQHEAALIPVEPFLLDDISQSSPTSFEFTYILDDIKYIYGFAATKEKITKEYLYHFPKGRKALVFFRNGQEFAFPKSPSRKKQKMICGVVAPNQLYFAVTCTMNEKICAPAMRWFRNHLSFSWDYNDSSDCLIQFPDTLQPVKQDILEADLGIQDIKFEINNGKLSVYAIHLGSNRDGQGQRYSLPFSMESDGTKQFIALASAIEHILACGGVLLVDKPENHLHPLLMRLMISKFQNPNSNPNHAQLIFTTHSTGLLDTDLLRKDQIYFVDKDKKDSSSSLYSISEFSTLVNKNVRKSYLLGKYGAVPNLDIEEVLYSGKNYRC